MLQHKYLSVHVSDSDADSNQKYLIFLERTMFDVQANQASFNSHPDCPCILNSIQQSVSLTTIYVPLPQPDPESESLLDTSPSPSIAPSPLSSSSLASLQGLQGSREVWRKLTGVHAHDQFLLGTHAHLTHGCSHIIGQLRPRGLTLFHLMILANMVHDHSPLYSLFSASVTGT